MAGFLLKGCRFGDPWAAAKRVLRNFPLRVDSPHGYRFTTYDAWLYALARHWRAPELTRVSDDGSFTFYRIDRHEFCWPADARVDSLPYIYAEVFEHPFFNPHAYEWGPCRVHRGDHVLDAGACEGFFSLFALERGATVYAVEPVPALAQALRRTLDAAASGEAHVVAGLLGRASGEAPLTMDSSDLCMAKRADVAEGPKVQEYALDDLVDEGRIPRVDFLKADVEGAEGDLIAGAQRAIMKFRPRISLAVYHTPSQARDVRDYCSVTFPRYSWRFRGLYAWHEEPRPYMLHGWPIDR
ncbi:MAG: FkbM family methyltransferase [Candidatus Hydrogenedentes bacterium]|nr:FkbM family methyltransferase [Candidatus Hydrogenedentota bacterium]